MVDLQKYMNLAMQKDRYEQILKVWKRSVRPTLTKTYHKSFTSWVTGSLENSLLRHQFLKSVYPNLILVSSSDDAFIIEDLERKVVVKVYLNDTKIDCTSPENKEDYIIFACLHPLFGLSG